MSAVVAETAPRRAKTWDFTRLPAFVEMARGAPGRIALLLASALLMRPITPQWPLIVVCAAAVTFTQRRHAVAIVTAASLMTLAFWPTWYTDPAASLAASRAGLPEALSPFVRWGASGAALAFSAAFLALVRSGRPAWLCRHPFLGLLAVLATLVVAAQYAPVAIQARIWLWSLASALGGYIWILALIAGEQRNAVSRTPFLEQFIAVHPVWGSTGTPYAMAPKKMRRFAAASAEALLDSQIRGFRLLIWAEILMAMLMLYSRLVHGALGIPTVREAIAAYLGPGLPWTTRWLSLICDFFEAILRIAVFGHAIVAGARLVGYNLPRNTYRPLSSRTLVEFWGRYYYYFKELMLNLFYFPAFLTCFRAHPRLRAAFATFMAAGVGNLLFHAVRELDRVPALGLPQAVLGLQTYAFYCLILATGIVVSQLRSAPLVTEGGWLKTRAAPFLGVMLFFCLLQVFDDTRRTMSLLDHLRFFVSLFQPFR